MQSELAGHKSKPAQVELKYLQLLQIYKRPTLSSRKSTTWTQENLRLWELSDPR